MCGIVGYYGTKDAVPLLLRGLKRLEYRGYDSAGLALLGDTGIKILKKAGKVIDLERVVDDSVLKGIIGIGHTRWATHGEPNDTNAHPHLDQTEKFALIHNGIIENYSSIKTYLEQKGVQFRTETDTEALVHLISFIYSENGKSFEKAVCKALKQVVGTYGIIVLCADEPQKMIAARHGSPLVMGVSSGEYFIASDASPIVDHTREVIYLEENEYVLIDESGYRIKHLDDEKELNKPTSRIDFTIEEIEKGNYPHFMLKEIYEQEHTITDTMRGARHIYITACGSSWHAGMIGKYLLEEFAGIPVHLEYASEFRYRDPIVDARSIIIAISQSGETADTIASLKKAKDMGALTMGICNVVGSTISRETDCGIYTHAGPEIGVASTKAFTAQVSVLFMLALHFGRKNKLNKASGIQLAKSLAEIGPYVKNIISNTESIETIAKDTVEADNFLYLGRGMGFPVALEGALKLKEISYIHAEGYPAAEMKHGPIALIDEKMPVVFLAPHDKTFEKVVSNIQEVKARKGQVITVTDKITKELEKLSDYIIEVSTPNLWIFPILSVIPLQLLAYHLAVLRGCDVDMPRNLAKSVTVE
jgi:glucosamine--fructose-6-phosphate aminotransferase (isomerizing)